MMGLADEEGRPLLLLVVKATYTFGDSGLKLADTQVPVKWGGEPRGKPGESSDKYEPGTAFIKPATDVVLLGHAYPPQKDAMEGLVALQVGPLKKAVRVVGERTWFRNMGHIAATRPLPFDKLPLTWERAFGGWDRTDAAKNGDEPDVKRLLELLSDEKLWPDVLRALGFSGRVAATDACVELLRHKPVAAPGSSLSRPFVEGLRG